MLRLVAYSQDDTTSVDLDLFQDEKIALTLNVDDIRTVSDKIGSYSKDFDLPATKKNNKFFKSLHNIDVISEYNPYQSTRAELYEDSALIYSGRLFLDELVQKGGEKYYTATLISNSPSLFSELEGKTFKDLDLSALAHTYTKANIEASWTSTGVTLSSGSTSADIYYPLVDNGIYWSLGQAQIHSTESYTPFIRLKYIVDAIFNLAGFEYNSSFFNSDYFKSIYMDTSISGNIDSTDEYGTVQQEISGASQVLTATAEPLILGQAMSFDAYSLYNETTGVYTAPINNTLVSVFAQIPISNTYIGEQYEAYLEKTIGGVTTTELIANMQPQEIGEQVDNAAGDLITNSTTLQIDEQFGLPSSGDSFRILVKQVAALPTSAPTFASIVNEAPNYEVSLVDETLFYTNGTIDLSFYIFTSTGVDVEAGLQVYRGEVELTSLLKDIITMFNLTLEDTEHPNEILIEPFSDFVATGSRLDWTNKVDRDTHKRIFVETPNKIVFTFNNDTDDYVLTTYKEEVGQDYGSMVIHPTSNLAQIDEEIVKEVKTENISASAFVTHYGKPVLSVYKKDEGGQKERFKNSIRVVFKNTTQYYGVSYDDDGIFSGGSNWVSTTHYDSNLPALTTTSNSLNFGNIVQLFSSVDYTVPNNNLYNKYWHDYIAERYSNDLKVVSMFINLTPTDIHNFTFANTVTIDNQEYRVNKIEYNAGARGMAKVELYVI